MIHGKSVAGMAAAVFTAGALFAQAPAAKPAFEVASIKPAPPLDAAKMMGGQIHIGMNVDGARVDIGFLSLSDLIRVAYGIKPYQLEGPDWMSGQRWDILAKMPEGATKDQVPEMLQALLAERFKLAVRHATTEHSIYALVVGKNGAKLKPAEPDPAPAPAAAAAPGETPPAAAPAGRGEVVMGRGENQVRITQNAGGRGATVRNAKFGQMKITRGDSGGMRMEFSKMKISDLADMLSPFLDRPVIDMTGLSGSYQVALELTMEDMMRVARASGMGMGMGMIGPAGGGDASHPADAASTPSGSIFAAIQQLGLKLDSRKAPVEMIVVEHLEKTPTEN
jgi:uncharacterized protein (TIGR03435 family)